MNKCAFSGVAFVGAVLMSSSVLADDMSAPTQDWSGFYLGLQGGYDWGKSQHIANGIPTPKFSMDGFLGGATVGFNHQTDRLVLGIESDISLAGIHGRDSLPSTCLGVCNTSIDWLGTVRGRAGFSADKLLVFATGGLAVGGVDAELKFAAGFGRKKTKLGWTVGGGAEWAVSPNISVKAEYLYVDLGRVSYSFIPGTTVTASARNNHIARLGFNWHF